MAESTIILHRFEGINITTDMLEEAAELFSNHYGIWSSDAATNMGAFAKAGGRVRMSVRKLKEQCLPTAARNSLVRVFVAGKLVGNVFAARWTFEGRNVCWITQLVVHTSYRRMGLATLLLNALRIDEKALGFGVLSSHPATVLAALRAFNREPGDVNHEMARVYGHAMMASSPVEYVRIAQLRGSVFGATDDGTVCCADTGFFVDHEEILNTLATIKASGRVWPFGELPEGHEYLVMIRGIESSADSAISHLTG